MISDTAISNRGDDKLCQLIAKFAGESGEEDVAAIRRSSGSRCERGSAGEEAKTNCRDKDTTNKVDSRY